MRFWDDSGLTSFRSKFGYPRLKDSSVPLRDSGVTTKFMVRLWQKRYRECPCRVCEEGMNFWFSLC